MTTEKLTHTLAFEVRDYECDMQCIVSHAVYLNYLEHARHVFLASFGLSFKELTDKKIFVVAKNIEVNYMRPLRSGDCFEVYTELYKISKLRIGFNQAIKRKGETCLESVLVAVPLNADFKPFWPVEFSVFESEVDN